MIVLTFLGNFFAGAFLANSIPHLAAGLRGEPFPTPFAKPPGQGPSSPVVNALWGSLNLFLGLGCLDAAPVGFGLNVGFALFVAGFVALAIFTASHFGKVRAKKN